MTVSTESFDLTGKVALVTGASGGLGQSFTRTLHRAGASVVLCSRDADKSALVQLCDELNEQPIAPNQSCTRLGVDVVSQDSVNVAFDQLDKKGLTIDILINNAGVAVSGQAHTLDESAWNQVVDTNLRGAWSMSQQMAQRLIDKQRAGSIVNVASILGLQPSKGTAPYAISKAGVIQMTRALALEWARHNIRVNAISPGYIETDINRDFLNTDAAAEQLKRIPTRKIGVAEDLSGPLLLLVSAAGQHMTGANLVVDGGHSCLSL